LCRFQPGFRHAVLARLFDHGRIVRVEEDVELFLIEILFIGRGSGLRNTVCIIEHHAQIADAAYTGFRTYGRLTGFDARIAEDALFGLARAPVVINLLVGAAGDAHAPAAALFLIDQDDAVILALVDRAGRAGRNAGRVEAVLAKARQVHHEGVFELAVDFLLHALEILVLRALGELAAENFFPVRAPFDLFHPLARNQRARAGGRHGLAFGRRLQMAVIEVERLV